MHKITLTEPRLTALSSNELFASLNPNAATTVLDLSTVTDTNPVGALNLLLSVQWLRSVRQRVHIRFPNDIAQLARLKRLHVLGYLRAMGASYSWPGLPEQSDSSVRIADALPVISINKKNSPIQVATQVLGHLRSFAGYPEAEAEAVVNLISELCANVLEHSRSRGGFIVIQVIPGVLRPSTVIAMGDTGIGLRESLRPYYEEQKKGLPKDDATVIYTAVRPGVTSTGELGRGGGLAAVRRLSQRNGYHLGIRTGNTLLHFAPNGKGVAYVGSSFPGTQVYIALEHHVLTDAYGVGKI